VTQSLELVAGQRLRKDVSQLVSGADICDHREAFLFRFPNNVIFEVNMLGPPMIQMVLDQPDGGLVVVEKNSWDSLWCIHICKETSRARNLLASEMTCDLL